MPEKLMELLLRIIGSSCGIEDEQNFFTVVLPEIHRYFKPVSTKLFMRAGRENTFEEVACYPVSHPPQLISMGSSDRRVAALDTGLPILIETPKGTQLLLPMRHDKSPMLLLSLSWQDTLPPECIRDERLMICFNKKLGSYLPWKYVMLKIAAAKRRLEEIFDHLPSAVSLISSDYTIERVNRAFTELFDTPFSEAIGRKCYEMVPHAASPEVNRVMETALEERGGLSTEARNGKTLRVTCLPLVGHDSQPKSLQIFQLKDEKNSNEKTIQNYDFFQLYNSLSQPMTVLSLMSTMIESGSDGAVTAEYLDILRKEISSVMSILKEAHCAAKALA